MNKKGVKRGKATFVKVRDIICDYLPTVRPSISMDTVLDDLPLEADDIDEILEQIEERLPAGVEFKKVKDLSGMVTTVRHLVELWDHGEVRSRPPESYPIEVRRLCVALNAAVSLGQNDEDNSANYSLADASNIYQSLVLPESDEERAKAHYEKARENVFGRPAWEALNPDDPYDAALRDHAFAMTRQVKAERPEEIIASGK